MADADWPYDADQHDPLTKLRIPVTSAYPGWHYLVALCIGELWHDPPLRPTDAEAAMIASYIDYRRSSYSETWQRKLLARPFDVESAVTVVLMKQGEDDWCHRLDSWRYGPVWVPTGAPRNGWPARCGLAALLDGIVTHGHVIRSPGWEQWKAAHPEAFRKEATPDDH